MFVCILRPVILIDIRVGMTIFIINGSIKVNREPLPINDE